MSSYIGYCMGSDLSVVQNMSMPYEAEAFYCPIAADSNMANHME